MYKKIFDIVLSMIVIIAMAACSSNNDDSAQNTRNNTGMRRLEVMQKELNLTDAQVKEVEKIFQDSRDKMIELRNQNQGERKQMMEMMFEMRKENDEKIKAILNEDQKIKFEEYMEERDTRMKERMGRRGGRQKNSE